MWRQVHSSITFTNLTTEHHRTPYLQGPPSYTQAPQDKYTTLPRALTWTSLGVDSHATILDQAIRLGDVHSTRGRVQLLRDQLAQARRVVRVQTRQSLATSRGRRTSRPGHVRVAWQQCCLRWRAVRSRGLRTHCHQQHRKHSSNGCGRHSHSLRRHCGGKQCTQKHRKLEEFKPCRADREDPQLLVRVWAMAMSMAMARMRRRRRHCGVLWECV